MKFTMVTCEMSKVEATENFNTTLRFRSNYKRTKVHAWIHLGQHKKSDITVKPDRTDRTGLFGSVYNRSVRLTV